MKKLLYLICIGFSINVAQSQEIQDAVRYAQDNLNGTARFRAMGGAFGALGGDLSSLNVNPAGSAIFSNNQLSLTFNSYNTDNNSNYFGTSTSESESNFELNQTGGVFVFKNRNTSSNWTKFSFAINYDNTDNFDDSVFSAGVNPINSVSVDKYFISYANGVPLGLIRNSNYSELDNGAQQAYLGYEGYIINPVNNLDDNNTLYISNVTPGGNYYQENYNYSTGYNGKLSFNAATSYKDKLYIGLNLNSHFTDFARSSSFYESNRNNLGTDYTVTNLRFNNNLYTYGTGFSFQIGSIAKVTKEIRLGFAYDSPIWYDLNDEFSQNLTSVRANIVDEKTAVVDPQIINYYAPYELNTPQKFTYSFAYVFGKTGLISIDYSHKDYGDTQFEPENDPYFRDLNAEMGKILKASGELRLGAEYKIKEWSFRGGYRFEESPYKNGRTIGDLNSFSGGLGYNLGMFKIDLAYTNSQRDSQHPFFNQGFTDGAKIKTTNNNFTMTLLFEM